MKENSLKMQEGTAGWRVQDTGCGAPPPKKAHTSPCDKAEGDEGRVDATRFGSS